MYNDVKTEKLDIHLRIFLLVSQTLVINETRIIKFVENFTIIILKTKKLSYFRIQS